MVNTRKLLSALESVANEEAPKDVLASLELIRSTLARETTGEIPAPEKMSKKELTAIQDDARRLLKRASRLAKTESDRTEVMRVAAMYMGQYDDEEVTGVAPAKYVPFRFRVRAVWRRPAIPALELVGPEDASAEFLIGYACWLVAKSEPTTVWLRTKRKRCENKDCGRWFPDISLGRPKMYCGEDCYQKMRKEKIAAARKKKRASS